MQNYTPDEARTALADVDLRRRQLAATARPLLNWPMVVWIALAVTNSLLIDLPPTAAKAPILGGVLVVAVGAQIVLYRRRRVRLRASAMSATWWLGVVVMAVGSPVVWWLAYHYIGQRTPLPFTVAADTSGLYLMISSMGINRFLDKR